jgi:hypothetical protein
VTLEGGGEPGQVRDLSADGSLRLVLTNDTTVDGEVVVSARVISRDGYTEVEVAQAAAAAGEPIPIAVEARELALPRGTFDFAGGLGIDATLVQGGSHVGSATLDLHFHPNGDGWRVYDTAVLLEDYGGGGLTDAARDLQHEADELAAEVAEAGQAVSLIAVEVLGQAGGDR